MASADPAPVATYSFDEGEGSTVEDLTGNGHTATIHDAKWTTKGRYGGALEFNAPEETYVSIPASEELDNNEELTVEAWVRPTVTSPNYGEIVMKEREGNPAYTWTLDLHEDEPNGFFMRTEEGMVAGGKETMPLHRWTHVAMTNDGARNRLYVNGELVDTEPGIPFDGHGEIRIGGNSIFGQYFDGRIDEVRIYDRALSEAEVQGDGAAPLQTPQRTPVAAYSFDEGEGTVAADSAGEHDATIEGADWARGRYGGSLKFDGEDMVTIPASEDLNLTEEFTLEAWIKPEAEGEYGHLFVKEDAAEEETAYVITKHESRLLARLGIPGVEEESPTEILELGSWQHIAATYDGDRIRLYVNGELVGDAAVAEILSTDGALRIGGADLWWSDEGFKGRIDEVRVYNRALSAGEVAKSMAPLPVVQTTEAYGVEDTEAIMVGTVDPRGRETSYVFQYGPTKAYGTTVPEETEEVVVGNKPREVEEVAEDLEPETTYHYRIIATSDAGTVVGQDQTLVTGPVLVSPRALQAQQASLLAEGDWKGFFNMDWSGKGLEVGAELNLVEKSGAKMFRVAIGAPSARTNEIFKQAAENHITILPGLGGNKMEPQDPITGTRPAWRKFVEEIVNHYGHGGSFWTSHPGIPQLVPDYWEIWNEENYGANGNQRGEVDPLEYGDVLREAREVLQENDTQAEILLGGLLTVSNKPGEIDHETVGEFVRHLDEAGYSGDYDALSLHPYAFKGNVNRVSKQVMRNIHIARAALDRAAEGQGKKIWITEIGWPVGNPNDKRENDGHHIPVSEEKQKELLESVFQRIKEHSGSGPHGLSIEKVFYYNVQDNFYGIPNDWSMSSGLREDLAEVERPSGKRKTRGHGKYRKAWFAFQHEAESEFEGTFP